MDSRSISKFRCDDAATGADGRSSNTHHQVVMDHNDGGHAPSGATHHEGALGQLGVSHRGLKNSTYSDENQNLNSKETIEMMNNVKASLEVMTVAELKQFAKVQGIVGVSKMRKAELIDVLIEKAKSAPVVAAMKGIDDDGDKFAPIIQNVPQESADELSDEEDKAASEASRNQSSTEPNMSGLDIQETQRIQTSITEEGNKMMKEEQRLNEVVGEAETTVEAERVESAVVVRYISSNNLQVRFTWNGVEQGIGWSEKDFKFYHINYATKRFVATSYANMIRYFKPLKDGVHGDIARVVKALARIKGKPAKITLLERKAKQAQQSVGVPTDAQPTSKTRRGVVDPSVLSAFTRMVADAFEINESDVRRQGKMIREFMDALGQVGRKLSEDELYDFIADYIADNTLVWTE